MAFALTRNTRMPSWSITGICNTHPWRMSATVRLIESSSPDLRRASCRSSPLAIGKAEDLGARTTVLVTTRGGTNLDSP